jgi:hypothetical protein
MEAYILFVQGGIRQKERIRNEFWIVKVSQGFSQGRKREIRNGK